MILYSPTFSSDKRYGSSHAFSLLELLVVIGIMGMLFALSGPIVSALKGAGDLGKASGDIGGIFEQARSYAMANNTYVYVGVQEVDQITPTANSGIGRIALAAVASRTGMRPYPVANRPTNLPVANITPLGKARYFENLHITNAGSLTQGTNMTSRPGRPGSSIPSASVINLVPSMSGNAAAKTTFQWPISGAAQYNFTNMVVEFSPQGTAAIQTNGLALSSFSQYIEIALHPTRGNVARTNANQAAIQINGITGGIRVYRP
jgi:prepilin-type N-terminal cleavage/methylation domain-containing protein